jgi:hypothetical protein
MHLNNKSICCKDDKSIALISTAISVWTYVDWDFLDHLSGCHKKTPWF